jgi:hypothetical protein
LLLVFASGGGGGRAAGQAKLPLPDPGAAHPAQFLRLMTRLCEEMKKAVAIGATAQFVAKADLSKEGPVLLVEPSLVHLGRDSNGRWVLEGPVALDAHLREEELQAESTACSVQDNSNHVNVRALHESVTWATCKLRTPSAAQCQLRLERVWLMPWRARTLEHTLPSRSFTLTLMPNQMRQRRASVTKREAERH